MTIKELSDIELIEKILKLSEGIIDLAFLLKKQSMKNSSETDDDEVIDDLHKLAMEDKVPDWVRCGGTD